MANRITRIVEQINDLPIKEKEEVNKLLEHNEWGIALENLCVVIFEENLPISKSTFQEIKDVGEAMELDSSLWGNISVR